MNGFLGTQAPLLSDLSLIASVLMSGVAAFGGIQARKKNFSSHCPLMAYAAGLNWIPVLVVMVPVFVRLLQGTQTLTEGPFVTVPIFHGILGTVTQLLMTYTVTRMYWVKSLPPKNPLWLMRAAMLLWLLTVLGGIGVYTVSFVL